MKTPAMILAALVMAGAVDAATVVLKGGKQLQVASYQQQGNYVLVHYADGRAESYPVAAVDLAATRTANAVAEEAPTPVRSGGPHSPFAQAVAATGETAARVTDEDVQHIAPREEGGEEGGEQAEQAGGQVVLLGYEKQLVGENQWAVTATISNTGTDPVRNVAATVKLMDEKGVTVGSGTASFPGTLGPGQQGMISTAVVATGEARQISFEFKWQTIKAARPATPAAEGGGQPSEVKPEAPPAEKTPGWEVPPGASPNALPENPMAVPPLTTPPIAPQVRRGGGGSEG
jgi:hypothetical protein